MGASTSDRIPVPSAIFVGRDEPLQRILQSLVQVPVAVIYGVAGIGKSTLAFAVAERWTGALVHRRIAEGEPLERLIDDARRALAHRRVPELGDDEERMVDLAERLDRARALLVLDDLHRLDLEARRLLIHGVGQLLRRGRMIATTRELPELGTGIDRLELRLTGLDEDSARALWLALDGLYAPAPGFEVAWRRAQGHPLLLRQAHAGAPADDPYAAALAMITPDERAVANTLALGEIRLSTAMLERLLPEGRVRAALRRLGARLILDIYPDRTCALHDLFREPLRRTMSDAERAAAHAGLARLVQDADVDIVTKVRELCRHLMELGQFEEASDVLVSNATELVRHGATRALLHDLEEIPVSRRTTMVQIVHARTRGRLLDLRGAHHALAQLLEAGAEPRLEVLLGYGPIAMLTGHAAAAERAFAELLDRPDLAPWPRVRAQFAFGLLRAYQGSGDEGRAFLRGAIAQAGSRDAEGVLLAALAYCYWLDERDDEAAEPVRRASSLLHGSSPTVHSVFLAPAALAVVLGRMGRFADAEPWIQQITELLAQSSDARSRIVYKAVVASLDYERGARARAMAGLLEAAREAEDGGDMLGALWTRTYLARLLLVMGRRRQALVRLDEVAAQARATGLFGAVHAVERSRWLDPLAQLRAPVGLDVPSTKISVLVRARCIAALRAAREGEAAAVTAMLEANAPLVAGADYALDRALGHLALAVLARVRREPEVAKAALAEAQREARAGEVDSDVLPELDDELGHLRIITGRHVSLRASYPELATLDAVVLDGRSHELWVGGRVRPLARQAVLREILYALAAQLGRVVSKQDVAARLWSERYDPVVHDNRLWANIRRLRQFLDASGLAVEFLDDGYRLGASLRFVFIEPVE